MDSNTEGSCVALTSGDGRTAAPSPSAARDGARLCHQRSMFGVGACSPLSCKCIATKRGIGRSVSEPRGCCIRAQAADARDAVRYGGADATVWEQFTAATLCSRLAREWAILPRKCALFCVVAITAVVHTGATPGGTGGRVFESTHHRIMAQTTPPACTHTIRCTHVTRQQLKGIW